MMGDFELLKEVPGYKAILKVVLKSQIQLLIDQLCEYTGEESFILTANASDGAQSLLGSSTGKGFLENHTGIKTEFLGYCLKALHCPEETFPCLRNTRTKVRSHPYAKNTSSPTSKNCTQYYESNGFPEYASSDVSNKTYLNDTRGRGASLTTGYHASLRAAENNFDNTCFKRDASLQQDTAVAQSQDMNYDEDYMQASSDVDHSKHDSDRENNVLMVKQEVEEDDVEVTGVELGQAAFLNESKEYRKDSVYNHNATSYDDTASLNSSDIGLSDMSTSELNVSDISATKHCYPCRYCGRVFQHNSWLTRHLRSHTGEKPYECHICGKRFTRSGTMKVHMLMHTIK